MVSITGFVFEKFLAHNFTKMDHLA